MSEVSEQAAPASGTITFGDFQVAEIPKRLGWVRMVHPSCAGEVDFVNPTEPRLSWYASIHDCDAVLWTRNV